MENKRRPSYSDYLGEEFLAVIKRANGSALGFIGEGKKAGGLELEPIPSGSTTYCESRGSVCPVNNAPFLSMYDV